MPNTLWGYMMRKAIVFNNTGRYHNGCKMVMKYIHTNLHESGCELTQSVWGNIQYPNFKPENFLESDIVIINGEGTMHSGRPLPMFYINLLAEAQRLGKKTYLVNTVWQNMPSSPEINDILKKIDYIGVREVMSQQELDERHGVRSHVHLDCSYYIPVPFSDRGQRELVIGKFFSRQDWRPQGVPTVDIFKDSWEDVVNILRGTRVFVTGRHHELYAACKARCPFVFLQGNTHKNEGLLKTAGVEIPYAHINASNNDIRRIASKAYEHMDQYEKLFNFMERHPKLDFSNILD